MTKKKIVTTSKIRQASISESEIRVTTIIKLMLSGMPNHQIIKWVNEDQRDEQNNIINRNWKMQERGVYKYIKKANDYIKQESMYERDKEIGLALMRYEDLYQQNYLSKTYSECRNILKERAALLGLSEAAKIDITTQGNSINNYEKLSHEELIAMAEDMGFVKK